MDEHQKSQFLEQYLQLLSALHDIGLTEEGIDEIAEHMKVESHEVMDTLRWAHEEYESLQKKQAIAKARISLCLHPPGVYLVPVRGELTEIEILGVSDAS